LGHHAKRHKRTLLILKDVPERSKESTGSKNFEVPPSAAPSAEITREVYFDSLPADARVAVEKVSQVLEKAKPACRLIR
jgi:hypothetical protein